jgi:hypothetical protein
MTPCRKTVTGIPHEPAGLVKHQRAKKKSRKAEGRKPKGKRPKGKSISISNRDDSMHHISNRNDTMQKNSNRDDDQKFLTISFAASCNSWIVMPAFSIIRVTSNKNDPCIVKVSGMTQSNQQY